MDNRDRWIDRYRCGHINVVLGETEALSHGHTKGQERVGVRIQKSPARRSVTSEPELMLQDTGRTYHSWGISYLHTEHLPICSVNQAWS